MKESEKAVLSCILECDGEKGVDSQVVEKEDFGTHQAQLMFDVLCQVRDIHGQINIVLLKDFLENGHIEKVSIEQFLDLGFFAWIDFPLYVEKIKNDRRQRELMTLFKEAQRDIMDARIDNAEVITRVQERMKEIYSGVEKYDFPTVLQDTYELLEKEQNEGIEMPTGFLSFDTAWGGIMRNELHVIAGDSGHFKTTLTLNLLVEPLKKNKRVLWIDREMGQKRLVSHYCAILGDVDTWRMRKRSLREIDKEIITQVMANIQHQNFVILDDVRTLPKIRESILKYNPDILVIDNLQNMDFPKSDNFWTFQTGIVGVKDLAMDYNIAVIALSQVTRKEEDLRLMRPPTLESLFGSRAIKHNADVIAIVYWQWKDYEGTRRSKKISEANTPKKENFDIYHAKLRENEPHHVIGIIDPEKGKFSDSKKSISISKEKEEPPLPLDQEDKF